jgi:hypothetical protein
LNCKGSFSGENSGDNFGEFEIAVLSKSLAFFESIVAIISTEYRNRGITDSINSNSPNFSSFQASEITLKAPCFNQ